MVLVSMLVRHSCAAEAQTEPTPLLSEEIRHTSPDGKHALRITYDRRTNDDMLRANETRPNGGIFSQTIESIAIVSLPAKAVVYEITEAQEGGNQFERLSVMWSSDSNWCAFYFEYPELGYTNVFRRAGKKLRRAHPKHELENLMPMRWVRPGVLDLGNEDGPSITATFDGGGQVKLRDKKR